MIRASGSSANNPQRIRSRRRGRRTSSLPAPSFCVRLSVGAGAGASGNVRGFPALHRAPAARLCGAASAIALLSRRAAGAFFAGSPGAGFLSRCQAARPSVRRSRGRRRRAPSPSAPRRDRRAFPAAAAPPASGTAAWRGDRSGSARRSIRPLSHSLSSRRVSEIGCRSSISASSDCLSPSDRSSRTSTTHCARVIPNCAALWSA